MHSPDDEHDPEAPTAEWRRDHDAFVSHCLATIPHLQSTPGFRGYPVLRIDETAPDWEDPGYFVGEFFWSRPAANPVQQLAGFLAAPEAPPLWWVVQGYGPFNEAWKTTIDTLALTQVLLVTAPDLARSAIRKALTHCAIPLPMEALDALRSFSATYAIRRTDPAEVVRSFRRGRMYSTAREMAVVMTALRWSIHRVQPEAPSIELVVERSAPR